MRDERNKKQTEKKTKIVKTGSEENCQKDEDEKESEKKEENEEKEEGEVEIIVSFLIRNTFE